MKRVRGKRVGEDYHEKMKEKENIMRTVYNDEEGRRRRKRRSRTRKCRKKRTKRKSRRKRKSREERRKGEVGGIGEGERRKQRS